MSTAEEGRSLGQLVSEVTTKLSELVHDEIALLKQEIRQDVKRGVLGSGFIAVAAVLLLLSLPLFSFALAYGIHDWTNLGLPSCFAIVGAGYVLIAGVLGLIAMAKFKKIKPPQSSIDQAQLTAETLKSFKPHPNGDIEQAGPAKELPSVSRSKA
ncbi:phage holin family protein [Streptomyces sp. NPDC005438]|uniref:phage holin family protein n=1 Tax=Streptomyces sp. NPDC005438 TaxID=3156880 RepID=UPI00339F2DED